MYKIMELRPATKEDLAYSDEHSISKGAPKDKVERVDYVYTLEHEGDILAVGGFRVINTTTAWCWADLTHHAGRNVTRVYRAIKEWIDSFMAEHDIKRMQAYVDCEFTEGIRLVKHLGFKKESIMKCFTGDRDAFMYVRIKEQ